VLEYLVGESGVLTLIGIGVAASWIFFRLGQQPPVEELQRAPRVKANA
jgi:hypothetical protein